MAQHRIKAFYNQTEVFLDELKVSVEDRAFMFGDAVYEVLRVYHGRPFLLAEHMARLSRSLDAMEIQGVPNLHDAILTNIAANNVQEGMVYIQISRGSAPRNHSFYQLALTPNILIYTKPFFTHPAQKEAEHGIRVITHEDLRHGRCDIKTVNLLPNCLAQSKAHSIGFDDAIFIRNGYLTEATSSNVFIVKDGVIKTPPLSQHILPGIRRQFLIKALMDQHHQVSQVMIPQEELLAADEVFITSTIKEAISVVAIDQIPLRQARHIATLARRLITESC